MDKLSERVAAVNKVNAEAKALIPKLQAWLKPFLGQKIINADGAFIKKLRDTEPQTDALYWINKGRHHLWLYVKTAQGPSAQTDTFLASIDEGVLTELPEIQAVFRTDFTVEEIQQGRKDVEDLQNKINRIKSELSWDKFQGAY